MTKHFPTDPYVSHWRKKWGLKPAQLLPNHDRGTMLALNVFGLPTPWGYRYEVFYEYRGELLDIGTVEYLNYRPVFNEDGKITDVVPFNHCFAASVVGVERLAMILQGKQNVWEIDSIWPLIEQVQSGAARPNDYHAMVVAQAIRVLNRIVADGGRYTALNKRRREYARNFYRPLFASLLALGAPLTEDALKSLFQKNASLQPWNPELAEAVGLCVEECRQRFEAFRSDSSLTDPARRITYRADDGSGFVSGS